MQRVTGRWAKWSAIGLTILVGSAITGCGAAFGFGGSTPSTQTTPVAKVTKATTTGAEVSPSQSDAGAKVNSSGSPTGGNTSAPDTGNSTAPGDSPTPATVSYPTLGVGSTGPQVLALNERLAELHYLPVAITNGAHPVISASDISAPPAASFAVRYRNTPASLAAQFAPETYTALTEGAVIAFEHQNGLAVDGVAGPQVWSTILGTSAKADAYPISYVLVQESHPETLQLWDAGHWVLTSDANTGVPGAVTVDGTFPIYLRYRAQTMTGTNPNGTHYSDPGVPYVNYFNGGDAVHGFVRASYGFPQSDGCVELPVATALKVWTLVHYGTLVSVQGQYS